LISHRGNTNGRVKYIENNPQYINLALDAGFDCEIDVYIQSNGWWLGHNEPVYQVDDCFLKKPGLWCHAKSIKTFYWLLQYGMHCFWHQEDWVTLTSRGYIWTFPGYGLTSKSISVLPELGKGADFENCAGICSDYIEKYKEF
jgi:hypothetical protein